MQAVDLGSKRDLFSCNTNESAEAQSIGPYIFYSAVRDKGPQINRKVTAPNYKPNVFESKIKALYAPTLFRTDRTYKNQVFIKLVVNCFFSKKH